MELSWPALIVAFIGSGAVGGIFSAWAQWGIEKRRMLLKRRQDLVDQWRRVLTSDVGMARRVDTGGPPYAFMTTEAYASIRRHLSSKFRAELEKERVIHVGGDYPRRQLIEEIARIERKWGLV